MVEKGKQKRPAGRPQKRDGPSFDEQEVDNLLVHGEAGPNGGVKYPTYRQLAEKVGVSCSTIADFAKRRNCVKRRDRAQTKTQQRLDDKLVQMRVDAITVKDEDVLRAASRFIVQWENSLIEGSVRTDSVADLAAIVKVRETVLAKLQVTNEQLGGPSLEEIQKRHKQLLEQINDSMGPLGGQCAVESKTPSVGHGEER